MTATEMTTPRTEWRYEVTVWNNINGDVEKYERDCSEERLQELRDWYAYEPWLEVVIDRSWEEALDEEDEQ